MTLRAGGVTLLLVLVGSLGCSSNIDICRDRESATARGGSGGMAGSSAVGGSSGTSLGGTAGVSGTGGAECHVTFCQGKVYECGNCIDDDGDGAIDSDDVYCSGPCDASESSYAIGIREGNGPACKLDCFFDSDVGSGNDGCNWSHRCDPLSLAPDYPPSGDAACSYDENASIPGMAASCEDLRGAQDPMCETTCGPLVPNGCDCFGCCELPAGSGRYVWLGSEEENGAGCTDETLDDPALCRPCTQVPSCTNTCEPCEICVGRTTPDASCGGTEPACPTGMAACNVEDGPRCSSGEYCITGCCVPEPK
jgi:hypothetical protein